MFYTNTQIEFLSEGLENMSFGELIEINDILYSHNLTTKIVAKGDFLYEKIELSNSIYEYVMLDTIDYELIATLLLKYYDEIENDITNGSIIECFREYKEDLKERNLL